MWQPLPHNSFTLNSMMIHLASAIQILSLENQEDGTLALTTASTFDYAWMSLGLYAQNQQEIAKNVSAVLLTLAREDGGWSR